MAEFAIITDSACDLGAELVQVLNVGVAPLTVNMEGREYPHYPDCRALDITEFYAKLRSGVPASTSAVNMAGFMDACRPNLEAGLDVLMVCFSSGLSSTCHAGCMAAEELREQYPDRKIYVVDTLAASLGQGLLVWHAAQKRKAGESIEAVRDWLETNRLTLQHWFTVEDLHHLRRGGRVSAASAVVGSMLSIKPVLHVDREGKLAAVDKVRGRAASLKSLVDRMEREAVDPKNQMVFISHGDCPDDAESVANMIEARMGTTRFYINSIGPVVGAHAGTGTVALFFLGKER